MHSLQQEWPMDIILMLQNRDELMTGRRDSKMMKISFLKNYNISFCRHTLSLCLGCFIQHSANNRGSHHEIRQMFLVILHGFAHAFNNKSYQVSKIFLTKSTQMSGTVKIGAGADIAKKNRMTETVKVILVRVMFINHLAVFLLAISLCTLHSLRHHTPAVIKAGSLQARHYS